MDLISRQDAIDAIMDLPNCYNGFSDTFDKAYIIGTLEEVPSADQRGTWIEMGTNKDGTHNIKCSKCGEGYKTRGHARSIATKAKYRFCPTCGARMVSEE